MSKIKKSFVYCIALMLILSAGCGKKSAPESVSENHETAAVSEETTETFETAEKIDFFKSGKWVSGSGIYYFFDGARGFLEHRDAPDTNTDFSYELNNDGTAVFHFEKTGTSRNANINFKKPGIIDIMWENGNTETLNFDTEEIPDSIPLL